MATQEQYQRFIVNEPESEYEIRTVEIYHPSFGVKRYVDAYKNVYARLEDGAPRNAGTGRYFEGVHLKIEDSAERGDSEQLLTITMGVANGEINGFINQISGLGYLEQIEVIFRKYYSGSLLDGPAVTPSYLYASNISFENGTIATLTAEDINLESKRAGAIYTVGKYKGLA